MFQNTTLAEVQITKLHKMQIRQNLIILFDTFNSLFHRLHMKIKCETAWVSNKLSLKVKDEANNTNRTKTFLNKSTQNQNQVMRVV